MIRGSWLIGLPVLKSGFLVEVSGSWVVGSWFVAPGFCVVDSMFLVPDFCHLISGLDFWFLVPGSWYIVFHVPGFWLLDGFRKIPGFF